MNDQVRTLYAAARREGRGGETWFVLADRLTEIGHRRLARRLSRAVRGWRRLTSAADREDRELTGPSPRGSLSLVLAQEWTNLRFELDRLLKRSPTPADRALVRRAARAFATATPLEAHRRALALAAAIDAAGWPANERHPIVPTGIAGPPERWQLITLDVWGNEREGFEVNNRFRGGIVELPTELTVWNATAYRDSYVAGHRSMAHGAPLLSLMSVNREAREGALEGALREHLAPRARVDITYVDDGFIEVTDRRTGEPIFHLERIDEDA